tara:strand:- start:160 stop:495 length:336 start_codon:yes stop_codon:yes gene_type:complete
MKKIFKGQILLSFLALSAFSILGAESQGKECVKCPFPTVPAVQVLEEAVEHVYKKCRLVREGQYISGRIKYGKKFYVTTAGRIGRNILFETSSRSEGIKWMKNSDQCNKKY